MASGGDLYINSLKGLGLVYWGRKVLNTPARLPQWDRWLTQLWKPVVVIVVAGLLWGGAVLDWLDNFFLTAVLTLGVVVGWQLRAYRPALWIAVALAPYTAYLLLNSLLQPLLGTEKLRDYDSDGNFDALGILWMGIFLLVARSQHKTLVADERRRTEEAEAQKAIAEKNTELEYLVQVRTAALQQQTEELRHALAELTTTQTQLIQAEKMASLGELTAGIAHEIQNPLNFVNNFAEVSSELAQELAQERARPTRDQELETELLLDLKQNLQKITQHGQRASRIVRGMLEHSRASSGERTLTDVNALAEEYLRLAYHGLRAKDKRFNATLETELAPLLPLVEAVSQDLGRVLLNLFTNAFYAVQQRQQAGEAGYVPTVQVSTGFVERQVVVKVRDNGTGMPAAVEAKIFQPFFTTKPSGEGTGLGLSLSHDIVVQGHGGALEVESQPGEGTTFTVRLPL